jgi:oligopeptide/dipeptide ABC transporter ATP-binding protein
MARDLGMTALAHRELPDTAPRPLVRSASLTKDFSQARRVLAPRSGPVRALHDVSFDIAPGEVFGVVGESGSGKSTLGRLMLRLIEPTAGKIFFNGHDLGILSPAELRRFRRHMQMIFQDPFASLNPRMAVGDALLEPLRLHRGLSRAEGLEEAGRLVERVGLRRDQLSCYPRALSGGQRQRVAIARAVAPRPRFIVADEPVSSLDVSIQAEVLNLLQDLQCGFGLSLMFISHDLSAIEVIADRVMVLYLGRVMELAATDALFARPAHPYTAALMAAAPGSDRRKPRFVLSGEIPSPSDPPSGCVFRTRCPFAIAECARVVPALRAVAPGHLKACIRDDLAL